MPTNSPLLLDDRLLIARLLDHPLALPVNPTLHTTTYWYYRACRAAVTGGAGRLSGPFRALRPDQQAEAISAIVTLPDEIALPDPRPLVPIMVQVHRRHPQLNLLNLEATATAHLTGARVLLSSPTAQGVLPAILNQEAIEWDTVDLQFEQHSDTDI